VARNRKRAKERRSHRPAGGAAAQPGLATARTSRGEQPPDPLSHAPDPLEHATPDVEIAEAQMALGRPELVGDLAPVDGLKTGDDQPGSPPLQFEARGHHDEPDATGELEAEDQVGAEDGLDRRDEMDVDDEFDADDELAADHELGTDDELLADGARGADDELAAGDELGADNEQGPAIKARGGRGAASGSEWATSPAAPPGLGNRLVTFLQGSWRELQRVQWPDRRQVMQATGVVIGFVIVAGVFLGLADLLAGKLVNFILK
jgi:preprotein translocase subunit SecE